jgi:wyosine [tRNA(Phe)-imidazoG37] synthetase (radical SAM superfamily)
VASALERKLQQMQADGQLPDVLTFAGNGEPTCHPDFGRIIDDTILLRNRYCPDAKVSVLSNSTMILRPQVFDALLRVDNNILKLDTVDMNFISHADRPTGHYDLPAIVNQMKRFRGHCIIQTIFFHSPTIDNTDDSYVEPWLKAVKDIAPSQVMVYTIDRETPDPTLAKATHAELDAIADRVRALGIPCQASY